MKTIKLARLHNRRMRRRISIGMLIAASAVTGLGAFSFIAVSDLGRSVREKIQVSEGDSDAGGSHVDRELVATAAVTVTTLVALLLILAAGSMLRQDIRLRQNAEAAMRRAAREAAAASEAKSRFLAMVAHEIRTPLSAVAGMTELLMRTKLSSEQMELARILQLNSEGLSMLLRDLLDSSRIEAGHVDLEQVPFDPAEVIESVAEILAIRSETKGLELILDLDPALPSRVLGDPNRLRQVLMNLLDNAVKFTDAGEVVVCAAPTLHNTGEESDGISVSVRDTGIGLLPGQREKIFERFVQAEPSTVQRFGGTGLGLSISRSLVRLMGGELTLESEHGHGSVFSFSLPLSVVENPRLDLLGRAGVLQAARVLIVDPNAVRGAALARALSAAGAEACIERSLVTALDGLGEERNFDVIIADELVLRSSPGEFRRVAGELLGNRPVPPVVTLSSRQAISSEIEEGPGIVRVCKPVSARRLIQSVSEVLHLGSVGDTGFGTRALPLVSGLAVPRILLAKAESDERTAAARALASAGYQVEIADNGESAVAMGAEWEYDLILLDVDLPVLDGYQAAASIRAGKQTRRTEPVR